MTAKGTMARALDTGQMAFTITARADDLKLVDAVIEAGLFGTQPVNLAAHVERAGAKWIVTGLKGTIGGSDLTGHVTVDKRRGRTRLDGAVAVGTLDFEDLASDRSEEHTSELQSRMRISYAVFCLKKKKHTR